MACRVFHRRADTPDRRILAYRSGQAGYLACQRSTDDSTDDVVEVSQLSVHELGAAIAGSVGLTEPGTRPHIIVPGYVGYFAHQGATGHDDSDDDDVYSIRVADHPPCQPAHTVVANDAVTATATIQSRWQPPRRWGVDWTKNVVVCVQIAADGDYIYTPDFSNAVPVTEQFLSERIDTLIAEDVSALDAQKQRPGSDSARVTKMPGAMP